MRRIRAAVGITLFMDSVLYLALVPFLPYYADKFDLSKAEAGAVLAALPVAILVAAVPTGWLSGRVGARRVVIAGNVCSRSRRWRSRSPRRCGCWWRPGPRRAWPTPPAGAPRWRG